MEEKTIVMKKGDEQKELKTGFTWIGLIFGILWCYSQKLWTIGNIFLVVLFTAYYTGSVLAFFIILIPLHIFVFLMGRDWVIWDFEDKDFQMVQ